MANLRSTSTIGGRHIVSLDTMNEFIYQIQSGELEDKMKKSETVAIENFDTATTFMKDKKKNGIWRVLNGANSPGYNYGTLCAFSQEGARFQMYAPHKEADKSALYFRTGWDDDIKDWERVATKSMLDEGLNTKFNKTGGDISGNINASGYILSNNSLRVTDGGSNLFTTSAASGGVRFTTTGGLSTFNFDKRVNVNGEIYAGTNAGSKVWHSGNFNPNDYIAKSVPNLTRGTDLNTVITTGYYRCEAPVNAPSKITGWAYIEVIRHDDSWVLQKIYSFNGTYMYSRVKENGTWRIWTPLGGGMSYSQTISASNWTAVDGIYEMTITHNIGSENIASVMVTDSNKISQFTGFQVISSTVVKVFNSTNTAGKVIINAIQ